MQTRNVLTVMKNPNKGGGSYKRYKRIIKTLLSDSYTVHYFSNDRLNFSHSNLHFHQVPNFDLNILSHIFFIIYNSFQIIKFNIQNKVFCTFTFGGLDNYSFLFSSKIFGNPHITFIRNDWPFELKTRGRPYLIRKIAIFFYKISLFISIKILTVSKSETTNIKNITNNKIKVKTLPNEVPNSNNLKLDITKSKKSLGFDKTDFVMGYIGRLSRRKNVSYFLDSIKEISDFSLTRGIKVIIVGKGPEKLNLIEKVSYNKLENIVTFFDWQKDITPFICSLDVLVLPSYYEGCPNIILEAYSNNVISLGSNVKGIKDVLEYDELLFNLKNPKDLSQKLRVISEDAKEYNHLLTLSQKRKDIFSFPWGDSILSHFGAFVNEKIT